MSSAVPSPPPHDLFATSSRCYGLDPNPTFHFVVEIRIRLFALSCGSGSGFSLCRADPYPVFTYMRIQKRLFTFMRNADRDQAGFSHISGSGSGFYIDVLMPVRIRFMRLLVKVIGTVSETTGPKTLYGSFVSLNSSQLFYYLNCLFRFTLFLVYNNFYGATLCTH
jgi:hypothetical protein